LNFLEPSHETEWVEDCKCITITECASEENDASIDIRIITVPKIINYLKTFLIIINCVISFTL